MASADVPKKGDTSLAVCYWGSGPLAILAFALEQPFSWCALSNPPSHPGVVAQPSSFAALVRRIFYPIPLGPEKTDYPNGGHPISRGDSDVPGAVLIIGRMETQRPTSWDLTEYQLRGGWLGRCNAVQFRPWPPCCPFSSIGPTDLVHFVASKFLN